MKEYKAILAGDSLAFDRLYRQYCPIVYKMRKKYYLRGFDLDDWIQEGRIIFYKSLERYDEQKNTSIGRFFKMNLENHIKSLVRKQCAIKRTIDTTSVSLEQKVESQGETVFNEISMIPDDVLDQIIIRENLEELPVTLSPFEKTTFQEYMCGKNLAEIAEAKKVKECTIRSAYDRAKKKIKTLIYD